MPHALWESSFILTQFLVLNLAGWFWCLTNLLFFDITLLYYYILLKSSIIFCLFSGNICLSLRISLWSLLFSSSFNCFWIILWSSWGLCDFLCNFITNQVTSCFYSFYNCSFWGSFKCIYGKLLSMIKKLLIIFTA